MRLRVSNLGASTTGWELCVLFSQFGTVLSAGVVMDRTRAEGRSLGHAFVRMATGGARAIAALNGSTFGGRRLRVRRAPGDWAEG
jgi:RNA recognition motif-containing protein